MQRDVTGGTRLVNAAVFIVLEIAAVAMLKSSSTLQDIWINRVSHRTVAWLWGGGEKIRNHFLLGRQNDELAEENAALKEKLRYYHNLELSEVEKAAATVRKNDKFNYIPATVVKMSRNTNHNYIIINKGSEDGVTPYSGIITGKGVVGVISAVDRHYSYGLTLMNTKVSVSSRVGRNGNIAPLVWDGIHSDRAFVKDLASYNIVPQGDTVYTSGFSSIFPPDIPIGVAGGTFLVDGATNRTEVTLFQDFSTLRYVTVVENPERSEIYGLERNNDIQE